MKEKLRQIFTGRQGMDELSKLLFWAAIALFVLAVFLGGALGSLVSSFALMSLILAFARAFSRNLPMREAENLLLLRWAEKKKHAWSAWKDRFHDRKEYKYFKCPACGKWLRVPRRKGKIHINCRCGYTLYRRT
ncbi:MAG: hypothetical protein IKI39_02740 [Oscillospiraceae bacterium]|nr:hypothetical protein [Oscillospiraceae bacterium]